MGGYSQIQQGAIDLFDAQPIQGAAGVAEVGLHQCGGQPLQGLARRLDGVRVLVQADQTAGGEAFGNLAGMAAASGGAVQIDAGRVDGQALQAFVQKHGDVAEFHVRSPL